MFREILYLIDISTGLAISGVTWRTVSTLEPSRSVNALHTFITWSVITGGSTGHTSYNNMAYHYSFITHIFQKLLSPYTTLKMCNSFPANSMGMGIVALMHSSHKSQTSFTGLHIQKVYTSLGTSSLNTYTKSYCCLLMHACISIKMSLNAYTNKYQCYTHLCSFR